MVTFALSLALLAGIYWLWTPDKSRDELEAKYLEPDCNYLKIANVRIHLCDSGPRNAPPIVMLHGFGSSLQTWDAWSKALEADHRVIRFDLPGAGLTEADPTGDYRDSRSVQILGRAYDDIGHWPSELDWKFHRRTDCLDLCVARAISGRQACADFS